MVAGSGIMLISAYHAGVRLPFVGSHGDIAWIGADLCLAGWGFVVVGDLARVDRRALIRRVLGLLLGLWALALVCTFFALADSSDAAAWMRGHLILLWLGIPDWAVWATPHPWSSELWPWHMGSTWLSGALLVSTTLLVLGGVSGRLGVLIISAAILLISPVLRWMLHDAYPEQSLGLFGPLRLDAAAAGALIALWQPAAKLALVVGTTAALALMPLARLPAGWHWSADAMLCVGYSLVAVLCWSALALALAWGRPWKLLVLLGAAAGPCYLLHAPLIGFAADQGVWEWLRQHLGARGAALMTAVAATATLVVIAKCLRRWRLPLTRVVAPSVLAIVMIGAADGEPVLIDGLRLVPGGNLTSNDERMVWHPKASLTAKLDSNPTQTPNGPHDTAMRWLAGGDLLWELGDSAKLTAEGQINGTNYADLDERDLIGGSLDVMLEGRGDRWRPWVSGLAMRVDDPLIESGRSVKRDEFAADTGLKLVGETTTLGVNVGWRHIDYVGGSLIANRERTRHEVGASLQRAWTGNLVWEARMRGFVIDYDQPGGPYQDAQGAAATVGVQYLARERLTIILRAGAEVREHDQHFASDPGYDDRRVQSPIGEGAVIWALGESSHLHLRTAYTLVESGSANSAQVATATLGGDIFSESGRYLRADLGVIHRRDDGAPTGGVVQESTTQELHVGYVFPLKQGLALTADGAVRLQRSEVSPEFDQSWLRCGLAWAW